MYISIYAYRRAASGAPPPARSAGSSSCNDATADPPPPAALPSGLSTSLRKCGKMHARLTLARFLRKRHSLLSAFPMFVPSLSW